MRLARHRAYCHRYAALKYPGWPRGTTAREGWGIYDRGVHDWLRDEDMKVILGSEAGMEMAASGLNHPIDMHTT